MLTYTLKGMPYFLLFLLAPLILIGLAWVLFHRIWRGDWLFNSLNFVLFEIRFPKILSGGASEQNENNLLIMERFYDSLSGMKTHFVFEIAKPRGVDDICFYIAFSKKFYHGIKKQLFGFFPEAEIEPVDNLNILSNKKALACSSLKLKYDHAPFHTYKKLDATAINAMTQSMAYLRKENAAIFQILIRPIKKDNFEVNIRIAASADTQKEANQNLSEIESAFSQFENPDMNGFYSFRPQGNLLNKFFRNFHFKLFDKKTLTHFTTEELTSIFHWPIIKIETPQIKYLKARSAPPPMIAPKGGIVLGKNYFRGETTAIKLPYLDRRRHLFIAGQLGLGKKRFLNNLIRQDMRNGAGFGVIDLRGDLINGAMASIPHWRRQDIISFSPTSSKQLPDIDIHAIVDNGKIFLADLSKNEADKIENAALESILINKFHKVALERSEKLSRMANRDFYLYINEVSRSNVDQVLKLLAKDARRRHNINLIISSDSIARLPGTTCQNIFENSGSLIVFRPDFEDVKILAGQFHPLLREIDFINIDENHAHVKLSINNALTTPFNIEIEEWK